MNYIKWEKLSEKYNRLWVQKYSLGPTRREVKKLVFPLLEENPKLKILEIGCGTGQLIGEISEVYPDIHYRGIDVAEGMVKLAAESARGNNMKFSVCPVEQFTSGETFDLIICTHAFPYFPDKPGIMTKMAGLIHSGGHVIICNSSTNNAWDLLVNAGLKLTTSKARYLSIRQMKNLFKMAGLCKEKVSVIKERWYMPTIALFYVEKP